MSSLIKIFVATIIGGRRRFRKGVGMSKITLDDLSNKYFLSNDYKTLAYKTQLEYDYYMRVLLATKVEGKALSSTNVKYMTGAKARQAYEQWLQRGFTWLIICAL